MVANLTIGRKKDRSKTKLWKTLSARFEELAHQLIIDVDRDSDAYNCAFAAFKLPKEIEEEKTSSAKRFKKETKYAAEVPMEVVRIVHSILPMIDIVARKGNSNTVTDALWL